MSCQAKADGASCNCDPACGLVTLADAIDARIRLALIAERERIAMCFDHMSNAAYYDAQYDVSSAFEAAARELRE